MDTARQPDTNGWVEIKGNPITKTGVFEYLGSSMMPELEPNKIYKVYRPPEALKNEATINSFKLLPWIDDHTMLSEAKGNTSTDEVGIKGVTGEECYFDAPYLRINLKIFSEELALLIRSGKKELSAGYTCRYEMAAGVTPDGQQYDAIQTNIRGNHLALVEEGRAGSDVSVLDGKCFFTIDAKDKTMPPDMTQVHALLTQLMALFSPAAKADGDDAPPATPQGDADPKNPAATPENPANKPGDGIDADPSASGDPERAEAKDGDDEDEDEAMDTAIATLKSQRDRAPKAQRTAMDAAIAVFETKRTNKRNAMDARVRNLESQIAKLAKPAAHTAMDAAVVEKAINAKASLVRQLAPVVGAFDAADMSLSQVAEYGCTKLGLKPAKGQELTAMDAYFAGRQNKPVVVVQAQDAGDTAALENFLTGGK
ncbi:DUF2213 domain-containing protein [Limnohabitans sp.]|uniref:DUF2213 domain-containing protein n=1 Tax=Limnohabitans sp. TaxID=1907725 RepID=UPI00286F490F|nr:DUF2213 domain-containing protein [Limnohabitans sp.]